MRQNESNRDREGESKREIAKIERREWREGKGLREGERV